MRRGRDPGHSTRPARLQPIRGNGALSSIGRTSSCRNIDRARRRLARITSDYIVRFVNAPFSAAGSRAGLDRQRWPRSFTGVDGCRWRAGWPVSGRGRRTVGPRRPRWPVAAWSGSGGARWRGRPRRAGQSPASARSFLRCRTPRGPRRGCARGCPGRRSAGCEANGRLGPVTALTLASPAAASISVRIDSGQSIPGRGDDSEGSCDPVVRKSRRPGRHRPPRTQVPPDGQVLIATASTRHGPAVACGHSPAWAAATSSPLPANLSAVDAVTLGSSLWVPNEMGSPARPGSLASWVLALLPRCAAIPFTASGRARRRRPSGALPRAPATGANWLPVLAGRGGRGPPGVTDRPTGTHRAVRAGRR